MNAVGAYFFQSSVAMALFYAIYWVFLRKETFFSANRFFLVFTLILAVLLPFFPVNYIVYTQPGEVITEVTNLGIVRAGNTTKVVANKIPYLYPMLAYLLVATALFLRMVIQTVSLISLISRNKIVKEDGYFVVVNRRYPMPFSFFNLIFIPSDIETKEYVQGIIAHEKVHIRERHWLDLLIVELISIFFWFNPFVWLYERSVKQNHEYLADFGVLSRGYATGWYQAMLVNQMLGVQVIRMSTNLVYALYPNRLKMMTKMKTRKVKLIKLLIVLPALIVLLAAFAKPEYRLKNEKSVVRENPFHENTLVVKGKVVTADSKEPLPGASVIVKGTTIGTVTDANGNFKITYPDQGQKEGISANLNLAITFVGYKTIEWPNSSANYALKDENLIIPLEREWIGCERVVAGDKKEIEKPETQIHSDANNEKGEVFTIVELMPQYPGGPNGLYNDLSDAMINSKKSVNCKGVVCLAFTVTGSGKPDRYKVIKSDNEKVAQYGIEALKKMKNWTPGKQHGKTVPVDYQIFLEF